jgi:hypothetical protein
MRVVTIVVVLLIHVVFFILFAALRSPLPRADQKEVASMALLLLPDEVDTTQGAPRPTTAQAAHPGSPKRPAPAPKSAGAITPEPQPPSSAITVPAAPDWRQEMHIAANNEIEAEQRKRRQPSPLAPHDFSGVKPGSTDDSKPQFGWSHAATHRVEEIPTGGLLININDRCVVVWAILPMIGCRIGKSPARGNLLEHMRDAAAPGESKLP